jgi:cell wall-associated NlpC family hydrolase
VYHAGLYLGRGWIIHSSGSRAGVSIARISRGSWWFDQILWGRRLIRK